MTGAPKHALDVIQVSDPCPEPWDRMAGDDKVRFCGVCEKSVFHLSNMTRDEATRLLDDTKGRLCVRFYQRADGTVSTVDCAPVRFQLLRKMARRTLTGAAAMIVSLLGLVFSLSLFRLTGLDIATWLEDTAVARLAKAAEPIYEPVVMGEPAYTPPSPPPEVVHQVRQGGVSRRPDPETLGL